jgi:hypothetical protein
VSIFDTPHPAQALPIASNLGRTGPISFGIAVIRTADERHILPYTEIP